MPHLKRFVLENAVYHTTSATRGRLPLLKDPAVLGVVLEAMHQSRAKGQALILAYAIMPDHLHLLAVPLRGVTISDVMKGIKGTSAKAVNKLGLHKGPVWQEGFYDRVIRDEEHLNRTVEYIHRNPVAAGFVSNATDYPYCSAHPEAVTDIQAFWGTLTPGCDTPATLGAVQ